MGLQCFKGGEQTSPTILLMWKLMDGASFENMTSTQQSQIFLRWNNQCGFGDGGCGRVQGACQSPELRNTRMLKAVRLWWTENCAKLACWFTTGLIYTSNVPSWVWKEGNVIETYLLVSSEHIFNRGVFTTQQRLIFNNTLHLRALL